MKPQSSTQVYFIGILTLLTALILLSKSSLASDKPEPTIQFSGDFRIRHQSETKAETEERRIQRLQVRFGLATQIQEDLKFFLRLATGKDAVSGNQTLGDSKNPPLAKREFNLDLAYFDYLPFANWTIWGGKMPQPFTFVGKNQILLDKDITPEGFATRIKGPVGDNVDLAIQAGSFWIRENYDDTLGTDQTDTFLNGGQILLLGNFDKLSVQIGTGIFSYTAIKDQALSSLVPGATTSDKARGNTLYTNNNLNYYPNNFDTNENSIEIKYKESDWEFGGFATQLKNTDIDTLNEAKAIGIFASFKKFSFSWTEQEVQKDSVFSLFTDSDFAGGETSSKGQILNFGFKLTKKINLAYTQFLNKTAIETESSKDYRRGQLDLMMSF